MGKRGSRRGWPTTHGQPTDRTAQSIDRSIDPRAQRPLINQPTSHVQASETACLLPEHSKQASGREVRIQNAPARRGRVLVQDLPWVTPAAAGVLPQPTSRFAPASDG